MKTTLGLSLCLLCFATASQAANFQTRASQGSGANWTAAIWSNPPNTAVSAPVAGNTYELVFNGTQYGANTGNTRTRNPTATAGVQTFPGDSLTMNANTDIRSKQAGGGSPILDFPGVNGNPGLILNGGALNPGDTGQTVQYQGRIHVLSDSLIALADNGLAGVISDRHVLFNANSILTGAGSLIILQSDIASVKVEVTSANNTYSGTWIVKSGWLRGTGVGSLGTGSILVDPNYAVSSALVNPGTALSNGPARVELMYDMNTAGTLTLANNGEMLLHQNCIFSAVTVNGTPLSTGNHPYSELAASFPNNFPAGGSGSITVQPPSPPPAPLNVVAISGDTVVRLSWSAAPLAASYWVFSSGTSGGPYTPLANVTSTGYTNTPLVNGSIIYYVIQATNGAGGSPISAEVVGHPNPLVTGLTATGGTGQVALAWTGVSGGNSADSYNVKRSTTSLGPYTTVQSGVVGLSYIDTSVQNGTIYFYVVEANLTGGGGTSNPSDQASATTAPGAATLTVALCGETTANLTWTLSDTAIDQFLIEKSTDGGGTYAQIAAIAGTNRSYRAFGLAGSTTHTFQIRGTNTGGFSPYSNSGSVTTPAFTGLHVNFAAGAGNSVGNPVAPVPAGYVQDIGMPFGDQGNCLKYGWDRNIVVDGRYRQAANSPDLRYDTFMHMIKATPPAIWNIAIPNGDYVVHIVAGDPGNVDSVFQFDVEGVVTDTITPGTAAAFSNNWGDFTVSCTVTDGQLTIKSGPNSQTTANNNKICFIDITVPTPVVIATHPQGGTIEEGRRFTFSVTLSSGSPPLTYQWYLNGSSIQDATNSTYKIGYATSDQHTGDYWVEVSNPLGTATSDIAHLDVFPDITPPTIVSASSLDGTYIKVQWSEVMDIPSASDSSLYHVTGASVVTAQLLPDALGDSNIVILAVSGLASSTFDIGVQAPNSIYDPFGNGQSSDPITNGTVFALGSGLTNDVPVGTATDPLEKGSTTIDVNHLQVVAGGSDIWNAADGFRYVYGTYTGDFDMKVRVSRLDQRNRWSKAGIVVREDLAPGGRNLNAVLTPAGDTALDGSGVPVNDFEAGYRPTAGAATIDWGNWTGSRPTNAPPNTNAWLRMRRQGNIFTSYYSTNGTDWGVMGTTNQTFPSAVLLGLGTTAHNNGAGQTTTAVYEDLGFIPHLPPTITMQPDSAQTVNQGGTASFSVTATGEAPLSYQWKKDNVNINAATSGTYTINNVQPGDAGDYIVIVTNPNGTATSGNAHLDVRVPPSITGDPQSQTVVCGGSVTFNVSAGGSPTLSYQWRKGGMNIQDATGSSYSIPVVQQGDIGSYDVVVSNDLGSETSDPALLTIKPLISCPANIVTTCTGPNGATVNFTVTATDNCNPGPTVQCTPASGSVFAKGTTPVNCTATDKNGNTANCSFTVTVQDNTQVNLSIVVNGSTVTITWPQTCTTYQLQKKLVLDNNPNTWASAGAGQLNGSTYEVTVQLDSNSPNTTFYRLKANP